MNNENAAQWHSTLTSGSLEELLALLPEERPALLVLGSLSGLKVGGYLRTDEEFDAFATFAHRSMVGWLRGSPPLEIAEHIFAGRSEAIEACRRAFSNSTGKEVAA